MRDKRQWVRRISNWHLSIVATPEADGTVRVAIMPRTWRPDTNEKSPVAVVNLTASDLRDLMQLADANRTGAAS